MAARNGTRPETFSNAPENRFISFLVRQFVEAAEDFRAQTRTPEIVRTAPVDYPIASVALVGDANAIGGAFPSGVCVLNLGGPDTGHVWLLRQLTIARGDAPITSTLAGTGYVYVQAAPVQPGLLMPLNLVTIPPVLPDTSHWDGRQILIKANEKLQVALSGGVNGQYVFAGGRVLDYLEQAYETVFTL